MRAACNIPAGGAANAASGDNVPSMVPTRRQILIRRVGAVAGAAALTALLASVLLAGGGSETNSSEAPPNGVSQKVLDQVRELSVPDQVDQVMLLGFDGKRIGSKLMSELSDHQLGGVLVRAGNWSGSKDGTKLVAEMVATAKKGGRVAPVFATAQEAGEFRELTDLPSSKDELTLGDTGKPANAREDFASSAKALRDAGIRLDLAPIADVATLDSPVGARSFSDSPEVAAAMTQAALEGCAKEKVACAPGRFPGLGAANQDTDQGPASISLDRASLENRDLLPFRAAADSEAPAMMISLGFYSAYDAVTPAALTPSIVGGLLRDDLGFEGVAITDDLGAGAVKATLEVPEAAVAALGAGSDMLRIDSPKDQKGVREALLAAVDDGTISEARLAGAAARVLELKSSLGID